MHSHSHRLRVEYGWYPVTWMITPYFVLRTPRSCTADARCWASMSLRVLRASIASHVPCWSCVGGAAAGELGPLLHLLQPQLYTGYDLENC